MTVLIFFFIYAVLIAGSVAYASLSEWLVHKFPMHRPIKIFWWSLRYPCEAHAGTHHRIFGSNQTYIRSDPHSEDREKIPMAWWNGVVLIVIASTPPFLISFFTHFWPLVIISTATTTLYYGAYEYIHWCMHLPRERNVERTGIFFRLNGHHLLHHRYMNKNFNVVCPLGDWLLGTLLRRAPMAFGQAIGRRIPFVEPLPPRLAA